MIYCGKGWLAWPLPFELQNGSERSALRLSATQAPFVTSWKHHNQATYRRSVRTSGTWVATYFLGTTLCSVLARLLRASMQSVLGLQRQLHPQAASTNEFTAFDRSMH